MSLLILLGTGGVLEGDDLMGIREAETLWPDEERESVGAATKTSSSDQGLRK